MKKIMIGIITLLSFFVVNSSAFGNMTSKNEVSIPCYNSGLSFGLAGFSIQPPCTSSESTTSITEKEQGESAGQEKKSTDYR